MIPEELRERLTREGRVVLNVKAIPKASRNEVVGVQDDGSLKVKVTAAPDKGKANEAICALLADEFDVARRNVRILRGETSHTKQVEVVRAT